MKNRSVCFFNSNISWGGGEKWHYDISTRIKNKGFKVIVVTDKKSELCRRIQKTSVELAYITISNISFLSPYKIYSIYRILKREHIDSIIMNLSEDVKVAGVAAKLAGAKHIIYRRGSATPIRNSLINRIIFKHIITGVIANSEETKKTILQNNPRLFPREKITVIYNGVDIAENSHEDTDPLYKRNIGEIILGNAGRLSHEKGQADLIEVAGHLKKKNIPFKLLIAGEGKLKNELKRYAKVLDVEKEVIFLGFVENVNRFMQAIDIFLMTSFYEGFGYVIVEAMANRKPVVAFDVRSNSEIIEDGKTGFLIKERCNRCFCRKG